MTISVEKARSLVDMAYSGTIHEDKRGIALEVYVEAVNVENLVKVATATTEWTSLDREPLSDWERELLARDKTIPPIIAVGDRVRSVNGHALGAPLISVSTGDEGTVEKLKADRTERHLVKFDGGPSLYMWPDEIERV